MVLLLLLEVIVFVFKFLLKQFQSQLFFPLFVVLVDFEVNDLVHIAHDFQFILAEEALLVNCVVSEEHALGVHLQAACVSYIIAQLVVTKYGPSERNFVHTWLLLVIDHTFVKADNQI